MKKKVSPQVKEIISQSKKEAVRLDHNYLGTEHLLLGILNFPNELAVKILMSLGVDLSKLRKEIDESANRGQMAKAGIELGQLPLNRHAEKALKTMALEARLHKHEEVCPEHLLLAILRHPEGTAAKVLNKLDVDYENYKTEMEIVRDGIKGKAPARDDEFEDEGRTGGFGAGSGQQQQRKRSDFKSRTPVLDHFSRDLTRIAEEEDIQPVIGREEEINRILQVLNRKKKNSLLLIGASGVGKTAIVEGLALRIAQGKVPHTMLEKRIVALDMLALVSANRHLEIAERIIAIENELKKTDHVILFIEGVNLTASEAYLKSNIRHILELILERGTAKYICTFKLKKYHEYVEQNGILHVNAQEVLIQPSSEEETINILNNIKYQYEDFHRVTYSEAAISACVKLSRDIPNQVLPDRAVSVLDEAGAAVCLKNLNVPKHILDLETKIKDLQAQKNQAVKNQQFEKAADLRDDQSILVRQLEFAKVQWKEEIKLESYPVSEEDVKEVVITMINFAEKTIRQP